MRQCKFSGRDLFRKTNTISMNLLYFVTPVELGNADVPVLVLALVVALVTVVEVAILPSISRFSYPRLFVSPSGNHD